MSSASIDDPVPVELTAEEAAGGVDKSIALPSGRLVTIRVPAGTAHGALLRLPDADVSDPGGPKDVVLRVRVAGTEPVAPPAAPSAPARVRSRRTPVVVALVVVLALVAAGYLAFRPHGHPSAHPSAVPSASPALGRAAYQALLATADGQLTTAFQAVAAAKTPTQLRTATGTVRDTLAAQQSALHAATGRTPLVDALTALQAEAERTASAATSLAICGSASALPALTATPAADAVRAAAKNLSTDGYMFGAFLPPAGALPTRRPASGTYTKNALPRGKGKLTVTNDSDVDAVLSLALTGTRTTIFSVYVRAGGTVPTPGIKDGTYQAFEATGTDWDDATGGFTRACAFQQFGTPTTVKGAATQVTIAAHATLSPVDPDQFPS